MTDALQGEGDMLREQIQLLKAKEWKCMRELRETIHELETIRVRLNEVNAEIARRANAIR